MRFFIFGRALLLAGALGLIGVSPALAETLLRPFVLAEQQSGTDLDLVAGRTRAKLEGAGFEVVGVYNPYPGTRIFCVTNPDLLAAAAATERGAYAAVMRVAVTAIEGDIEVSFNNPVYLSHTYRLETDLAGVREALQSALGYEQDFGAQGKSADDLRDYNYAFLMEKFHHPWELGRYAGHAEAVAGVEQGLGSGAEGVRLVYKLEVPGTEQVLFGVAFDGGPKNNQFMNDAYIMQTIDARRPRSSAHLPYEILVRGRTVESLHARFRIAINFPDLKMVGDNSFMDIMSTPPSLENAMRRAVGVEEGY